MDIKKGDKVIVDNIRKGEKYKYGKYVGKEGVILKRALTRSENSTVYVELDGFRGNFYADELRQADEYINLEL